MFKWKTEVLMFLINPSGDLALQIEKRTEHDLRCFHIHASAALIYSAALLLHLESIHSELFSSAHNINLSTLC